MSSIIYDGQNRNQVHLDGERVYARFNDDTGRWEMILSMSLLRLGKVNQVGGIAKGGTGTVDIYSGSIMAEVVTSPLVSVTAGNRGDVTAATGKWCFVHNIEGSGWYILHETEV